jgi:acetylornithine/succinyldiaminopimelate/putrescine aminotransferase
MRLAERLVASAGLGDGSKIYFANSGAEANEAALKLARKARPGGSFVVAHGGFHGRTYGALSATPAGGQAGALRPARPGLRAGRVDAVAGTVDGGTAAVLIEPIQGESGVRPVPDGVLRDIRAACDEHGALLMLDEVQTGMGRTGTMWAHQPTGVGPTS